METGNLSHSAKVDTWMPLDIGRFLQDTMHLSSTQIGNYILLLMKYWAQGPLENDPEQLARIAREDPNAWSIAQAKLSMFFSMGEDGRLHQAGADRRIAEWRVKRQKAKDKARNAARARWDRYREKKEQNGDAPSIARAVHEQCPSPVVQVQKQKQEQKLPPTPSAARRGIDAPGELPGASPGIPLRASAPSIPSAIAAAAAAAPAGSGSSRVHGASPANGKSEQKKKPPENARTAFPNGREDTYPQSNGKHRVAHGAPNFGEGVNGPVGPAKAAARENLFKSEILAYWEQQNPEHPKLPWRPADDRALHDLLGGDRAMTLETFRKLLRNRARSDVNPSALPHKWLRSIMEYASGPVGKFGRPRQEARSL